VKSLVSFGRLVRDLKRRTTSGARYGMPSGVGEGDLVEGLRRVPRRGVEPIVGFGGREDDVDRGREQVVGEGEYVGAWG